MTIKEHKSFLPAQLVWVLIAAILGSLLATHWSASAEAAPAPTPPKKAAKADPEEEEPPPDPAAVSLDTKDGMALKATFYGSNKGKKAVPVIILHEWNGSREAYKDLALYLQSKGCAVLVPDLRGHGESTQFHPGGQERAVTLVANKVKKAEIQSMVTEDLEAIKRFLMTKNNAGELNIEKLCVVGSEMGAVVAANWAVLDWSWPKLPTYKQGQDVKALVLISPEWAVRGMGLSTTLDNSKLQQELSMMILVGGKDRKAQQGAERINGAIKRFHPEPSAKEAREKKTLFFLSLPTSLQGAKLVNQPEMKANQLIAGFIEARLASKPFEWTERKRP
ncbi:MAG: alpha/beta hydrolase [Planctomycetia bacterium]|nr:alpha/beta hydrolase [Planctomycetia bacterium]